MVPAERPADESQRIAALYALAILDTDPEERFDRITRLAQRVFGTSIALFSLIDSDRQWYKSAQGALEAGEENPWDVSICAHAMLGESALVIEDASSDERYADLPFVLGDPNVRFYAGHPVVAPGGEPLGTLCVIDDKPRPPEEFDTEALAEFAAMVEAEVASLSLAIGDEMTGLSNRRGYETLGKRLLGAAKQLALPVTAIYFDLDNMKAINDGHGHEAGDRAIAEVGSLLEQTLRGSDLIARLGGDEFCALLVGVDRERATEIGARLDEALAQRNDATAEPFDLSISLGLAESAPGGELDLAALTDAADKEMLAAKRERKAGR